MKKLIVIIMGVLVFGIAGIVLAQEMKGEMMDGGTMGKGMMGKGMMMKKGMMGPMMMHGMMNKSSMVATSDGGVIVLSGNKLTKYDKNLNVIKEVQIKPDEEMQKMMQDMMEKCPMMGMKGSGESKSSEAPATEGSSEKSEHESHH